jgi:uncharacterized membrane protein
MKYGLLFLLLVPIVTATTLSGTVYNENLDPEINVVIEIDSQPPQKYLTKNGKYSFDLSEGTYTLTAYKGFQLTSDKIEIKQDGLFIFDIFLLPDFSEESELLDESEIESGINESIEQSIEQYEQYESWRYWLGGLILILLLWRFGYMRKKYGPLKKFRKKIKAESKKSKDQAKEEVTDEHISQALDIIQKHNGRIMQKQLRKEMLYLSEAKVSLILTQLEHNGKIEKIKKGRGNVILLKISK